jgi:far upstream element-binding protein
VGVGKVFEMFVPDNLVGLIIGKGGETIKGINKSSGAIVFIPKEMNPDNPDKRLVRITGNHDQIEDAKGQIDEIV